jgi:hypothetical protein
MTRADDERAIMNEICENPVNYVRTLFSEGGAFGDTFAARANVFDAPMMVEVEISDRVYLTIDFWVCESDSYHQATYEACTETSSSGETAWKLDAPTHYAEVECEGQWPNVINRAAGDAMLQWANMMNYYTNSRYADEEYAWFFPMGMENAEQFKGLVLHADTEWNR